MDVELRPLFEPTRRPCAELACATEYFDKRLTYDSATLRAEMRECEAAVRRDISELDATLRGEMEELRSDLLKWGLVYWIGQAAATGAIVVWLLAVD